MRTVCSVLLLLLVSGVADARDETVQELKQRYESTHAEDRPELAIRIARHQVIHADRFYTEGKVEEAGAAVEDIVAYSEKARDAAIQTRKHLKEIEIDIRKMAEKLRDIKRTLAFDDQPPVERAIRRLEDARTTLLKEMFSKEKKEKAERP
jgi:hypothetical protein